ncbi:MAG: histidinol dehydrogenase [Christensenellales bacterium]|jgi:histidinol dehydrogenase
MVKMIKFKGDFSELFSRREEFGESVSEVVAKIIADVKKRGDAALMEYAQKFDGVVLKSLEVDKEEIEEAVAAADPRFLNTLTLAKANIEKFHCRQRPKGFKVRYGNGVVLGERVSAVKRAGIYVPGGTAAYPSTVLMNAVPAAVAGVEEIIMITPPGKDGKVNPNILAAAKIAGVSRVFKSGGAQGIAALAYGSESVPAVDVITGPGNAYVAEAKRQVFGKVGIDMVAGPSEILIIADGEQNPEFIAADMLAQAEHDTLASAAVVTGSELLAEKIAAALERRLSLLDRENIARNSIENFGRIIIVPSLDEALKIAEYAAPEHLELLVKSPRELLSKLKNAGSVFLGEFSPEAVGDYFAGANHTLPTSGSARFSSPLSVRSFTKRTQYIRYTRRALKKYGEGIADFAVREGLTGHAESVKVRLKG